MIKKTNPALVFFAGFALLGLVSAQVIRWFIISADKQLSFDTVKQQYLSFYPAFLQHALLLTLVNVLLLILAAACFFSTLKQGFLKPISMILLVVSLLLTAWQLFSIM
ncbi:MAG: hypothetical protein ACOYKE_10355 [Ferruginibacter sp.]